MSTTEHPILTYLEVEKAMSRYQRNPGIEVAKNNVISKALNDVACAPFTSFKILSSPSAASFGTAEDDKAFGSIDKPNVDKIMDVAKENQSKFGRGEQTVLDLDYRDGYEIEAKDLAIDDLWCLNKEITPVLNQTLFVGRNRKAELKLYKLAVYKEGGHFDWHRDSTHGDDHHGTVLVSLNTAWKGGALLLRHRGMETPFDMQPANKGQLVEMQVVAFYTDVEHKVDPVTEGVRVVLQYDVYVTTDDYYSDREDDDDDKPIYDIINTARVQRYSGYELPDVTKNDEALELLIKTLRASLKQKEIQEVGFPLRHLYRQQSILPQYLKGVDALMYRHLSPLFEVSLHPILLNATADYQTGSYRMDGASAMVYKCATDANPEPTEEEDSDEEDEWRQRSRRTNAPWEVDEGAEFYLYDAIDVRYVSSVGYIEHTGNDAQEAWCKYFGGGMFLRAKESAGDKRAHKSAKDDSAAKKLKQK